MAAAPTDEHARSTESGIPVKPVYGVDDLPANLEERLAPPGEFPYVRGPYAGMYRVRPWTMRQYAGFSTAEATNERFRYLLGRGQTGLSTAFDLPTQLGLDSDDPRAIGEVGRTGVAVDTIDDMRRLFDSIPLAEVSTSMTINAPASMLLLLYDLVAEEQGAEPGSIRGTIQNDILKEYVARGNYIFPPHPSMRLTVDTFSWCAEHAPSFNTISISGYHIREAGSNAVQEIAFTLAHGIAYVEAAIAAGLDVDAFAPRLSFFFNAHNDVFQEIAKSTALRFHAQTGGSTLTAQQPENNIVRVALQAFSAAGGGAQSIHTNGFDEALALPTERSAQIALRTQQILQQESGVTATADPFAGSYYVESLTAELLQRAEKLIAQVDENGGAVACADDGWTKEQIEQSAYEFQLAIESGEQLIIGQNTYIDDSEVEPELLRLDESVEQGQVERLAAWRSSRDQAACATALDAVLLAARSTDNMLPPMRVALQLGCSVGEICELLRGEWGTFD
jgi:methylmalonyl-CoA mutase N-terminal domain/subunit